MTRRSAPHESDVAQAHVFLAMLSDRIGQVSAGAEAAERRAEQSKPSRQSRNELRALGDAMHLRTELYELHRQIARLKERFPELTDDVRLLS